MKIRLYLLQTICSKPLFGVGVGEGISVAEALDYHPRHLFQDQLIRQPFPVAVSCLFLLAGQNGISRDRKAGQKGGTKGHFPGTQWQRDRKAGQNVWDRRAGTERLGSLIYHYKGDISRVLRFLLYISIAC